MTDIRFVEDATLLGTRRTTDGYLVGKVRCARSGIQDYAGVEVGRPDVPHVRVYRPEEQVFSKASMATYAHRPITNDHPPSMVNPDNYRDVNVGHLGESVARDGDRIQVDLVLMDAAAIQAVEGGKREVSMGYEMALDFTPGTTDDGDEFDAVASNFRMNHMAIVAKGRAGADVRIGDSWGAAPITTSTTDGSMPTTTTDEEIIMTLKTIVVDGLTVETTDAGEKAIQKLQAEARALQGAASEAKAIATTDAEAAKVAHDEAMAEKDRSLAAKDAEIDKLKGEVLTPAALDQRVAERSAIVSKAQAIAADADFTGKSDLEIKTMAVAAARGPEAVANKPDAYIDAMFDLTDPPKGDTFRAALKDRKIDTADTGDNGQSAYEQRISDAWKGVAA